MAKISLFEAFLSATQMQETNQSEFGKLNKMINEHIEKQLNATGYSNHIEIRREEKKQIQTAVLGKNR